jgi:FHS family L-fucose permease-like MFS transporter
MESFPFNCLFTVGLGFQFNKLANPLAKNGSPSTGAHRLTLAGGVNSLEQLSVLFY